MNHISKKVKCSEPYKQIHFDSRGNFGPCCQYIGSRENFSSITEYLNSNWLSNLKKELDEGKKINGCSFCWRQEEQSVTSMRQDRNNFYKDKSLDTIDHIMITYGNQCNTACRICNPSRSTLIEKQYIDSGWKYNENIWSKTKTWYKNINADILSLIGNIRKIAITGGEPFINRYFLQLLLQLNKITTPLPSISITTNGSFEKQHIELLKKFKHTHINFSIDGTGKTYYEYLRWPLKWNNTINKIKLLQKYDFLSCQFDIVPHNLNLLNIADSVKWLKQTTNYDGRFRVGFCWLNGAPWYKIDNSPKWVKEKVINDLKQLTQLIPDEQKEVNELINIIQNSNQTEKLDTFEAHVNMTDKWRGSNTWDILKWRMHDI